MMIKRKSKNEEEDEVKNGEEKVENEEEKVEIEEEKVEIEEEKVQKTLKVSKARKIKRVRLAGQARKHENTTQQAMTDC